MLEAGLELAGLRLQAFAEALWQAADASPEASCEELVRTAVQSMGEGALGVVADEPELCDLPLRPPARTVHEAAETALHTVGVTLLGMRRNC